MNRSFPIRLCALLATCALSSCASPAKDAGGDRTGAGAETAPELGAALLLQDAFAQVARSVAPSVVSVGAWRRDPAGGEDVATPYPGYRRLRSGSGFVVSPDGYILSSRHALLDPETGAEADLIGVELSTGLALRARLAAAEPTLDLAVLKVEPPEALRAVAVGDSDAVEVGHWAIALGDPEGPDRTFAAGLVSRRPDRECYQEQLSATLLQTSAQVPPESHGGPIVNIRGEVIGISRPRSPVLPALGSALTAPAYGLPIKLAMTLYEPLVAMESRHSPWLGFSVLPLDRELRLRLGSPRVVGIYIDDVFDPSPAASAGVRVGDVLSRIDGERVTSVADFQRKLYLAGIGRRITLQIYRDGELLTRQVSVAERPEEAVPR